MNGRMTVELKALRFVAYHGLYEEEQKTGNEYEVNLTASFEPQAPITDISETLNYVNLYELIREEMNKPTDLLETLAMTITTRIHQEMPRVKKISISIYKLHPPISKFPGVVGASYEKEW
jgi:dihydroneopterin aldolase